MPSASGSESSFSQPAANTPKSIAMQRATSGVNPFAPSPRGSPRASDVASWETQQPQQPPPAAQPPRVALTGEAALVTRWTVEELGAVGEAMLASEAGDGGGELARRYRFFDKDAGDLKLADVPLLLREYTELAQRHEALLRGVALMLESSPTGPEQPSERPSLPSSASMDALLLASAAQPDLIHL